MTTRASTSAESWLCAFTVRQHESRDHWPPTCNISASAPLCSSNTGPSVCF